MNYLNIEQFDADKVRVSFQEGSNSAHPSNPTPFTHPFSGKAMEELAWYYEEYLAFPYGGMQDRGQRIAGSFNEWGGKLFDTVFGNNSARENYFRAVSEGWNNCEIRIISKNAAFLSIPWEMLYDPAKRHFLAQQSAGLYRSHPDIYPVKRDTDKARSETFNILLIISRPYGERDVQLRTIARPMLEVLAPIADCIHLDVLRPPTFAKLKQVLEEKPGFYHLIHFDGHGAFDPNAACLHQTYGDTRGQGLLVFHGEDHVEHPVPAEELGETLTRHKIPLFVLNACQSAMQSENNSYGSVATALLNTGAEAVVAMSYSVYALWVPKPS